MPQRQSHLILGWKTNWKPGDPVALPRYWEHAEAYQGGQPDEDLFLINSDLIAQHTAVIAQSGSGKSFFMGRLIEEILLRTKAKCLILDPNADFRRIDETVSETLWNPEREDKIRSRKFTHETSWQDFRAPWNKIPMKIHTGRHGPSGRNRSPLQLWWPSIPAPILAQEISLHHHDDIYFAHEVMESISILLEHKAIDQNKNIDLIEEAHSLFRFARGKSAKVISRHVEAMFGVKVISTFANSRNAEVINFTHGDGYFISMTQLNAMKNELVEKLAGIADYVTPSVERYYFGKARLYWSAAILAPTTGRLVKNLQNENRIDVIDLPSLDENVRIDAIGAVLKSAWDDSRIRWEEAIRSSGPDTRVPLFIIVDEAHNLMPANPRNKGLEALRDEFRRIVAEGRKYGLFLIFISQRPDKLDPLIFSECENKVIMKLSSEAILAKSKKMLGMQDVDKELCEKCLKFVPGLAILFGKWTHYKAELIYGAARRTLEGGRDLDSAHWAAPS